MDIADDKFVASNSLVFKASIALAITILAARLLTWVLLSDLFWSWVIIADLFLFLIALAKAFYDLVWAITFWKRYDHSWLPFLVSFLALSPIIAIILCAFIQ